jgi:bifunctional DNase/RNase
MLVEVEVQSLGLDRASRSPVVVLRERDGVRVLPIWIGPAEASAIAMHMAGMAFPRPLTHDLAVSLIDVLGGRVERMEIHTVEAGTYHAVLVLRAGDRVLRVDARPSDSIAIALRTRAAIVVADDLLRSIDLELDESELPPPPDLVEEVDFSRDEGSLSSPKDLEAYLRKLDPEDFGRFTP